MNIVLAHGFLGFRKLLGLEYFRGVKQHLQSKFVVNVLVPEVPPLAGIEVRGESLQQQILDALERKPGSSDFLDPTQKTHIIAHSMGGLDSRFILSPTNPRNIAARVTSLTTIATPHRGSPVADLVAAGLDGQALLPHERVLEKLLLEIINLLGVPLGGLRDLTTSACAEFNKTHPDHPQVRYFSVAGQGRLHNPRTAIPLLPAFEFIRLRAQENNDGLVSVASARWGDFDPDLWPADHTEEVGHDLDHVALAGTFDHLARFDGLVQRLQNLD